MKQLKLSQIWIYPIKSLGGIRLQQSKVLPKGLEFDRRRMLVDDNNVFMSQRVYPVMALFKISLSGTQLKVNFTGKIENDSPVFTMDLHHKIKGREFQAVIWNDRVNVVEDNPQASKWFSNHLKINCRLVNFPEINPRPVDTTYALDDDQVSLADAFPFLMIGQASLDDLNRRLTEAVPMDRFRPNFVFAGGDPYEEDHWTNFTIGKSRFAAVKPCARCVLTTVNQDTGIKGIEPLATLSRYRTRDNKVYFGQNVIALDHSEITEGDSITLQK